MATPVSYTLTKYSDVYTLKSDEAGEFIDWSLQIYEGCTTWTEVSSGSLGFLKSQILSFPYDGEYRLYMTTVSGDNSAPTISYHINLQNSFILDTKLALCGCGCSSCEECYDCNIRLSALTKHNTLAVVSDIDYATTYLVIQDYFKCLMTAEIYCLLINEKYKGQTEIVNSFNLLLSLHYLTMYFTEYNLAVDDTERTFVDTKYYFSEVSKCLMKFGININEIKALF